MNSAETRVVIVTALPLERAAVLRHVEKVYDEKDDHGTVYTCGRFASWDVAVVETGSGNIAAALETERAIARFKPRLALLVGIAGGVKDAELRDVVVATKVYAYEGGADRGAFEARPNVWLPSYPLVNEARDVARVDHWRSRIRGNVDVQTGVEPKSWLGPIAAGEKVVKSSTGAVSEIIRKHYGDALAVEMEGAGFAHAAYSCSVDALVIRGVSDLLDKKAAADRAGSQEAAAANAAAFAFELLSRLAGRSVVEVARLGVTATPATDGNEVRPEIWQRVTEVACRLFPRGPHERDVWVDAGGDLSRLELSENGRTQWGRALRLLRMGGGGGVSLQKLLRRMLEEYGENYELQYLAAEVEARSKS